MKRRLLFAMLCIVSALGMRAQTWTGSEPAAGDFYLYNVGAAKFLNAGDRVAQWGTNACLSATYGLDFTLEANGTNYNLNSKNSNGGANNYLATTLWTDGGATPWTFTSVGDKVYNISNGGQYLAANAAGDDVELATSGDGANAQWILLSRENVITAIASATKDSPINISFLLGAPDFSRNDTRAQNGQSWTWTNSGGNVTVAGPNAQRGTYGCEFWNNTFDINQTLSNMPDGTYEFKIAGYGTNGTTYVYGNTTEAVFTNQTSAANFGTALDNIADGQFAGNTTGRFNLIGGTLKVGVKRTTNKSADWTVFDNAELIYYGLDLSEFESALAAAVAAAEAVEGTVPAAAYDVLSTVVTEQNKTYTTAEAYTAATETIIQATNSAKALQANYARYQAVRTAVLAINSGINVSDADTQANAATDNAGIDAAVATVRQALATYLPTATLAAGETIDLTDALIDNAAPGNSETTDYWTNSVNPGLQFNLYEFYNQAGATTKQTIATSLPAGNYKLTAVAFTRTGYEAKLSAGENSTNIATVASSTVNNREAGNTWIAQGNGVTDLVFNLAEATANLEIGLTADNANGDHWMCWRSFRLVYGDVFEPYTLVEGKMNAEVAATQTAADAAFRATPSPTTYMAVLDAIAAAQASIAAYMPMTDAINKIDAALAAATSATASADAYNTVKAAYTNATIADADIMTQVAAAYNAVIPVIKSQTAANADFTLAIQNQSFEYGDMTGWTVTPSSDTGVRETSNATYAATGSDGRYLFNTWWQGVPLTQALEGLPTGEYTLTVSVASDGATIYLLANGEHNEGTETGNEEVTTYPTKDTFQEATITFLVKDGNALIGVVGGAGGDAGVHKDYVEEGYWWYKADNFRLAKNRELTEEEMAVIPTAIALDETEVTLTAENPTKTFELTFTPEDATETVTWTTSDANVATVVDGVVTAVAPGTATITVTSTLDATVTASATVTVTFPETAVPASDVVLDGPRKSTVTYGENLIKNGTFEYPNGYYGWTDATAGAAQLTSAKFDIVTDGETKYLKAKASEGSTAAGSIGTSWAIEAGKTYVFGYRVKANQTIGDKSTYHKVTLTNTPGTETLQVSDNNTPVTAEWNNVKYKFTNTENYAYVQFRARWLANDMSFDDFYLVEVTGEEVTGNVQYLVDNMPAANKGTGAFQFDTTDADALIEAGEATVAEVEAAYEKLTTVNAPAEGQLFNVVLTYGGWTYDNKAMTYLANDRADHGLYNIQYKEVANTNLAQAFTFTKVEGNNYKMSQIDADGEARYISTGVPYSGNTAQIRTTTNADDALLVTVIPTATEGKWNLRNTEANQYIGSQDAGVYTVNSHIDFVLVETQKPSITINTTAAGWGTTMLPFAAEKPADVKVYTCAELSGEQLTLVEVDALEANKPYIIEGAWNETLTGDAQGTALTYKEGVLTGVYAKTAAPTGSYVMQKLNDKVGFYKVSEEKPINVPANRAYVTVAGSEVKAFYLDGTTGINGVFDALQNGDIYDLAGRKVQHMQKGNVYIVNGKKVVVK